MLLFGNGFNDLVHCRFTRKKEYQHSSIDETIIQIGNQHFWLWICIEPIHKSVLGIYISEERNMFVAENFIKSLDQNMENIQYTLMMVVHGIHKHATF